MKDNQRRAAIIVPMAAALLLAAFPNSAFSHIAGAGTVTGTLTDASGAVVPEAQLVVHNEDTGVDRQASTNAAGIYVAAFLQPRRYEVTATKAGFVKVVRTGLTLQVGQTLTVDLSLSLQTTQETVAVTAAAPVVDVEKTEVSQVVSENLVDNLPLVGRRWDNFVLLTPAVTTDGNSVSFRGISSLYNNNSVDGANNNQAFFSSPRGGSTAPYVYSLDSIQEFQVSLAERYIFRCF